MFKKNIDYAKLHLIFGGGKGELFKEIVSGEEKLELKTKKKLMIL